MKRQGSNDSVYRLSVEIAQPTVSATLAAHQVILKAGQSIPIKLNVNRLNGHSAPLIATATDLAASITATSAQVSEKCGELIITLSAPTDAKPASLPIRLMLLGTDPDHPFAQPAFYDLSKEATQQLIAATDSIWLTVEPLPPATQPTTKPATQPAPKR